MKVYMSVYILAVFLGIVISPVLTKGTEQKKGKLKEDEDENSSKIVVHKIENKQLKIAPGTSKKLKLKIKHRRKFGSLKTSTIPEKSDQDVKDPDDYTDENDSNSVFNAFDSLERANPTAIDSLEISENETIQMCWVQRIYRQQNLHTRRIHKSPITWFEYEALLRNKQNEDEPKDDVEYSDYLKYFWEYNETKEYSILDMELNKTQNFTFQIYYMDVNTSIFINETRTCGEGKFLYKAYHKGTRIESQHLSIKLGYRSLINTTNLQENLLQEVESQTRKNFSSKNPVRLCWIEKVFARFDQNEEYEKAWREYEVKLDTEEGENIIEDFEDEEEPVKLVLEDKKKRSEEELAFRTYIKTDTYTIMINRTQKCRNKPYLSTAHSYEDDQFMSIKISDVEQSFSKSTEEDDDYEDEESDEDDDSESQNSPTILRDIELKQNTTNKQLTQLQHALDKLLKLKEKDSKKEKSDEQPGDLDLKVPCPPILLTLFTNNLVLQKMCKVILKTNDTVQIGGDFLVKINVMKNIHGKNIPQETKLFSLSQKSEIKLLKEEGKNKTINQGKKVEKMPKLNRELMKSKQKNATSLDTSSRSRDKKTKSAEDDKKMPKLNQDLVKLKQKNTSSSVPQDIKIKNVSPKKSLVVKNLPKNNIKGVKLRKEILEVTTIPTNQGETTKTPTNIVEETTNEIRQSEQTETVPTGTTKKITILKIAK